MIVLTTGLKRSGKDTLAEHLVNNYGFVRYAFADPIREVCKVIFDWEDDDMKKRKEEIDEYYGISPRQAMQWIGTDAFQYRISEAFPRFNETVGRTIWVRKFIKWRSRNYEFKNIVVPDWRFPHEQLEILNTIENEKTFFIRVENERVEANDTHESEIHIPNLPVDVSIYNNGTIQEFYENIDKIFKK